mgnify:CR=1 FL=1
MKVAPQQSPVYAWSFLKQRKMMKAAAREAANIGMTIFHEKKRKAGIAPRRSPIIFSDMVILLYISLFFASSAFLAYGNTLIILEEAHFEKGSAARKMVEKARLSQMEDCSKAKHPDGAAKEIPEK